MLKLQTVADASRIGKIVSYQKKVNICHQQLHNGTLPMTGWVNLPNCDDAILKQIVEAAQLIRKEYTALVVIGIGGSYLGTKACYEFLQPEGKGVKLYFAGWNLSSRRHLRLLKELDNENPALCVVSKSGTTLETSLAFSVLKEYLQKRFREDYKNRIFAITDEKEGVLREEADCNGYRSFSIDSDIGGRYSVLTPVSLLPLAAAGCDIFKLMQGAKKAYADFSDSDLNKNISYRYAVLRNILYDEGKVMELFSFAEPDMLSMGNWLMQLFAESEGKNNSGIFPVTLGYSTDLHSVGQFLEEGNPIFFETMLYTREIEENLMIPATGLTYGEYDCAMMEAVYSVRNAKGTPIFRMELEDFKEESLGYFLYFFEKACALSCMLRGINPFNQPGVECYKKEFRAIMGDKEK